MTVRNFCKFWLANYGFIAIQVNQYLMSKNKNKHNKSYSWFLFTFNIHYPCITMHLCSITSASMINWFLWKYDQLWRNINQRYIEIRKPPYPLRYGGEFRGRKIYGGLAQINCFTFYRKDCYQSSYRYASGLSDSEFVTMTIP